MYHISAKFRHLKHNSREKLWGLNSFVKLHSPGLLLRQTSHSRITPLSHLTLQDYNSFVKLHSPVLLLHQTPLSRITPSSNFTLQDYSFIKFYSPGLLLHQISLSRITPSSHFTLQVYSLIKLHSPGLLLHQISLPRITPSSNFLFIGLILPLPPKALLNLRPDRKGDRTILVYTEQRMPNYPCLVTAFFLFEFFSLGCIFIQLSIQVSQDSAPACAGFCNPAANLRFRFPLTT